jgi:AraC family transcriptional regulator of adaptative response/methylated-DNA-[protein]-cysteine methyltransferase
VTIDPDAAWAAVMGRDGQRDGTFVYAVTTTGVYCRPSCPARRPLRANVRFFGTPAGAEAAGYRACKRCQPRATTTPAERTVARARAHLAAHVDEPVTLADLAREVGMSPHHLQRTFKRLVGVSPKQYVAALRADRLKAHLRAGTTVSRATFEAGYGASSRAYDAAAGRLGMTPAAYRRGGRGVCIRFVTGPTALGRLLVAATDRGVCAVTLGDDDAQLERALAEEYPNAIRRRANPADVDGAEDLRGWLASVSAHLEGALPELGVPIDVPGTPLQERVWRELRRIPYGETRSYTEIATAVGAPTAVRAVANACARNRVALVVPCHRVVREGGALGGYRWGLERKQLLLGQEHGFAARRLDSRASS